MLPSLPLTHREEGGLILSFLKVRFTLLEFEDLPRRKSLQDQAVLWRLQRLLSDELSDQSLRWMPVGRGRVLAALTDRSWLERVVAERVQDQEELVMIQPATVLFWQDLTRPGAGVLLERDGDAWQVSVRGPGGELVLVRRLLVSDETALMEEISALKGWLERSGIVLPLPVWLLDASRRNQETERLEAHLREEGLVPDDAGPRWPGVRGWSR